MMHELFNVRHLLGVLPVEGLGHNRKARERQKAGSEIACLFVHIYSQLVSVKIKMNPDTDKRFGKETLLC